MERLHHNQIKRPLGLSESLSRPQQIDINWRVSLS